MPLNKIQKAFTLIELLVVISIIALLAALILIPLTEARIKARDARIKTAMTQIRPVAALYFTNSGDTYVGLDADPSITVLFEDIAKEGGEKPSGGSAGVDLVVNDAEYCVEVRINSPTFWCVDYTGVSKKYDGNPACDAIANHYTCD